MNIACYILKKNDRDLVQSAKDLTRLARHEGAFEREWSAPALYEHLGKENRRMLTLWEVEDLIKDLDLDFNPPLAWLRVIAAADLSYDAETRKATFEHLLFDSDRCGHEQFGTFMAWITHGIWDADERLKLCEEITMHLREDQVVRIGQHLQRFHRIFKISEPNILVLRRRDSY